MNGPTAYQDFIENYWEENLFPKQSKFGSFISFWNQSVHDGVFVSEEELSTSYEYNNINLKITSSDTNDSDIELFLYE